MFIESAPSFALLDGVIDASVLKRLAHLLDASNHVKLFSGTFAAAAEKYSPVLIDLAQAQAGNVKFIDRLLRCCNGTPMLSFLYTDVSLAELSAHLKEILMVKTADEQAFFLRYTDVRILPEFFSVLTLQQRRAFLGATHQWLMVNHRDELIALTEPITDQAVMDYPLSLDEKQYVQLMDRTAPYAIVAQLEELSARFSTAFSLGERIEFVLTHSKIAKDHGFQDSSDVSAWCLAVLLGGEHFHFSGVATAALEKARQNKGNLFDQLTEITEDEWQNIRASTHTKRQS
jgi:hypothetical protein